MYRYLVLAATCLAFTAVVLGAFVRASDAGLGCPDWPGCYGHLIVPQESREVAAAEQQFPGWPVHSAKAWIEMTHRYVASALGLIVVVICAIAWARRRELARSPALPTLLFGLVTFQGMLGMWTVTLLLRPAIVTLHLLGGMITLALLAWLASQQYPQLTPASVHHRVTYVARAGLGLLLLQIALGGWVSSNFAALACSDVPRCQGNWIPTMDFANGFHLGRDPGLPSAGGRPPFAALTAIHWSHRAGALATLLMLGGLALWLARLRLTRCALALGAAVSLQFALGATMVKLGLPIALAVAHNAGAAILLTVALIVTTRLSLAMPQANSNGARLHASAHR
jgi:heme a synthase